MENIIAVCDAEEEYAHRLMEYINRKNSFLMKAAAFSNEDSIVEYSDSHNIAFMLISDNILTDRTSSVKAGKKVVLNESRYTNMHPELKKIYKYQSAEHIVREVMSTYEAEMNILKSDSAWRANKRMIGVYSPAGGARKTSFALALCQILARQEAVLYMNLESFSGISKVLDISCESDLGELLYYVKNTGGIPSAKLPMMTVSVQNVDIIPPVRCPEDLRQAGVGEWTELFAAILSSTSYETLILDMGNEISDIADILNYCSVVYVPVRDDPLAKARLDEMDEYLRARGVEQEKLCKLKLPFNTASVLGRDYYENLIWSELGDFTRALIQRGSIE